MKILDSETNRRAYKIFYIKKIQLTKGCCPICSRRRGVWETCWPISPVHDNPTKSWKYKNKKRKQWQ